jgi:hypothetical protein
MTWQSYLKHVRSDKEQVGMWVYSFVGQKPFRQVLLKIAGLSTPLTTTHIKLVLAITQSVLTCDLSWFFSLLEAHTLTLNQVKLQTHSTMQLVRLYRMLYM